jgi:hypothetical protein
VGVVTDGDATPAPPDEPTPAAKSVRRRRARGAAESLGAIVLGFESIIVFLAGLVVYGLKATPAGIEPWWGIVAGSVVALLMILLSGLLRHRWAIVVGWILQVVVALAAIFVPAILIIALIFGGMWGYATIKGASLDRRNARLAREAAATAAEAPETAAEAPEAAAEAPDTAGEAPASTPESPASAPESSNGV